MGRPLITERNVREAVAAGRKMMEIPPRALLTPLAVEYAQANGVELKEQVVHAAPEGATTGALPVHDASGKIVAFGSDHGGYQLKQILMQHAESLGYGVMDLGTSSEEPCDYPDFAYAVAHAVASGKAWQGVMIDGAGIGSSIVANKVPGIRAACCHSEFVARNAREHNDANVLTLGSRVTGWEVCKEILRIYLDSSFVGGRHKGRVDKMIEVERRFLK